MIAFVVWRGLIFCDLHTYVQGKVSSEVDQSRKLVSLSAQAVRSTMKQLGAIQMRPPQARNVPCSSRLLGWSNPGVIADAWVHIVCTYARFLIGSNKANS